MIAWLEGRLLRKLPDAVVLEAGGVGYRVFVTIQVLEKLPPEGSRVELEIHTQVREDAIQLFGFLDGEEREAFEALIGMSGFGPRAALTVLSGIDAREFARAVCTGDLVRLCMIPGVGKKKAERMVLDLKDKLMPLAQPKLGELEGAGANLEDLRSALQNLGFKGPEVEKALGALREKVVQGAGLDVLLPEALKLVRG
jgi:Holliday junction DNA helicase RuvA